MSPHRSTGISQPWPQWSGPERSVRRPRDVWLMNRRGLLFQGASSFLCRTVLCRRPPWGCQTAWGHLDYERCMQFNERAGLSLLLAYHLTGELLSTGLCFSTSLLKVLCGLYQILIHFFICLFLSKWPWVGLPLVLPFSIHGRNKCRLCSQIVFSQAAKLLYLNSLFKLYLNI